MSSEILVVAGEASGDHYGADLVHRMADLEPSLRFFGMGGDHMAAVGVELVQHIRDVSVMGFVEVLGKLRHLARAFRALVDAAEARQPAACVFIDFPDFNLRLAAKLREAGRARHVYYIGPTVWAWRPKRVHAVRKAVDRMLVIFPFEEPIYRAAGVPVEFVGHPLVGQVKPRFAPGEFRRTSGLDPSKPLVGLLPGSRKREIAAILPDMRDACRALLSQGLDAAYALGLAETVDRREVEAVLGEGSPVRVVEHASWDVMKHADVLLTACGTAPLEAALLGTPQVVVYRVSALTYGIASRLVHVPHICIVNLILERRAVPELVQRDFSPERAAAEVMRLLRDEVARGAQLEAVKELARRIGSGGAAKRAATAVLREAGLLPAGAEARRSPCEAT